MNLQKMPDAELAIDAGLVRTLLYEQHEDLASLPLLEAGEGWDNKLFRLGDDLVVRLLVPDVWPTPTGANIDERPSR